MPTNKISFSKQIDEQGRVTVPQEIRKLLGVLDREAVLRFDVEFVDYVDEQAHTDVVAPSGDHTDVYGSVQDIGESDDD